MPNSDLELDKIELDVKDQKTELENKDEKSMSKRELFGTIFGASIGHMFEWFDFSMFGLLADEIGINFFPKQNKMIQLLCTFGVFAGAFFMRPVGGALFGYIGDKYSRIIALRISLYLMAISTFITGCLPNYNQIGVIAPILLTMTRLIQGISVGGELCGAVTYILEISPSDQKAFYNAMIQVAGCGGIIGSLFVGILHRLFTKQQLDSWAWRIPFLFGVIVAIFGIWLRNGLKESKEFLNEKINGHILKNPFFQIFKSQKKNIITIILHLIFSASSGYTMYVWLPSYMLTKEINPIKDIYTINAFNRVVNLCFLILSALMIDKYFKSDPSFNLIIFGLILIIYTIIIFPYLPNVDTVQIIFIQMIWSIIAGMYNGGWSLWAILRLQDTVTRYSAFGVSYNIALALFGGTAPFIATLIILKYNTWILGLLLFIYGTISISTNAICYYIDKQKHKGYTSQINDFHNDSDHSDQ